MDAYFFLISTAVLLVLFTFGTFFSAAEMAFASLNRARIKNLAEGGGRRGRRAAQVSDLYENRFDEVISTLLICNNIVAITAATVAAALFARLSPEWGYLISTVAVSAVVIVLTDIFPKSMSKEQPERVAIFVVPMVRFLMTLLKVVNIGLMRIKDRLSTRFMSREGDAADEEQNLRGQELIFMVEEAEKEGAFNEEDSLLITNAIEFNDLQAWDIITPRVNIVSIPIGASVDEIAAQFLKSGYSRMPVYEDSLDNIRGIVHIRDFLKCTAGADGEPPVTLKDIITPALFTVTSARIPELLKLLKKQKCHMAIVSDEYGGTEGIVTMEDILEQLVGDILDENDDVVREIVPLGDGKHKVLGTGSVVAMFEHFDVKGESESNTVCGWIMDMLRRIPEEGDTFDYETLRVTVTKTDGRRAEECMVEVLAGGEA